MTWVSSVPSAPVATTAAAPAAPCPPGIIDLEASGFGRQSYPIEVGFVLGDGSSYCTLIAPAPAWTHWDTAAEQVHHISRETLQKHGRSVNDVAQQLNTRLRGQTLYSDGWAHDFTWLATLFEEAGMVPLFRIDSLRRLLNDDEAARWGAAKDRVGSECSLARHRASVDAWLLQQTWLRVKAEPASL
jgi:hypothetical protein